MYVHVMSGWLIHMHLSVDVSSFSGSRDGNIFLSCTALFFRKNPLCNRSISNINILGNVKTRENQIETPAIPAHSHSP